MTRFYATQDLSVVIELSDEEFMALRELDDESIDCWLSDGQPDEIRVLVAPFTRIGFLRLPHYFYGHTYTRRSSDLLRELEAGLHGVGVGVERVRVID